MQHHLDHPRFSTSSYVCFHVHASATQDGWALNIPANSPGGNPSHNSPEVLNALKLLRSGTLSARVDYSGQAVFELGMVLYEVALRKSPITGYPMDCDDRITGTVHYTDARLCADPADAADLASAAYPAAFIP